MSSFTICIPTKMVGGFCFLCFLCSIYSLQIFSMKATVTSVRWYFIVVLIGIDLIITDVKYASVILQKYTFVILHLVSTIYLLNLLSWKLALFASLFRWFTPRHFLRVGVVYSPVRLVTIKILQHVFFFNVIYINLDQLIALCPLPLFSLVTISFFFKSLF